MTDRPPDGGAPPPVPTPLFERWQVVSRAGAWAGVRATLPDRLPAVGAWPVHEQNQAPALDGQAPAAINSEASTPPLPVHLLTGLGARGLTLALLCADVLTAGLHGEPLPVERSLARRLRAGRWLTRHPGS